MTIRLELPQHHRIPRSDDAIDSPWRWRRLIDGRYWLNTSQRTHDTPVLCRQHRVWLEQDGVCFCCEGILLVEFQQREHKLGRFNGLAAVTHSDMRDRAKRHAAAKKAGKVRGKKARREALGV